MCVCGEVPGGHNKKVIAAAALLQLLSESEEPFTSPTGARAEGLGHLGKTVTGRECCFTVLEDTLPRGTPFAGLKTMT